METNAGPQTTTHGAVRLDIITEPDMIVLQLFAAGLAPSTIPRCIKLVFLIRKCFLEIIFVWKGRP